MVPQIRRFRLAALLLLGASLGLGCNLFSLPYFLMTGPDAKQAAEGMKLSSDDKDKENKVVILVYSGLDTRPEFVGVDRELSGLLTRQLQASFKENKDKVNVVPASKIQEFKNNHPEWAKMKLEDIGKQFESDFVVYLEIESLSLYEPGSANQLYRGRAEIRVELIDMNKPDEDPIKKEFRRDYPNSLGAIPVEDQNPRQFYMAFLTDVAQHLSWYFTAHPVGDEFGQHESTLSGP